MIFRPIVTVFFILLSLTNSSLCQAQKSEQKFKTYLFQLKAAKVDTILIIKSGCTGCEIKYSDTSKTVTNGQTIYVLTKYKRHFKIASFDDLNRQRFFSIDTCSLFDSIQQYKKILQQKEVFYKKEIAELKKVKFFPPSSVHYSYEELTIKISSFNYSFNVVDKEYDHFGFSRENEKWFKATKSIIAEFYLTLEHVHIEK